MLMDVLTQKPRLTDGLDGVVDGRVDAEGPC